MFFIINSESALIAADEELLEHTGSESIFMLAEEFRSGHIELQEKNGNYILNKGDDLEFVKTPIQTLFGAGYMYHSPFLEKEQTTDGAVSITQPLETENRIKEDDESLDLEQITATEEIEADEELLDLMESDEIPGKLPAEEETALELDKEELLEVKDLEAQEEKELIDLADGQTQTLSQQEISSQEPDISPQKSEDKILSLVDENLPKEIPEPKEDTHKETDDLGIGLVGLDIAENFTKETEEKEDNSKEPLHKKEKSKEEDESAYKDFIIGDKPFADYEANAKLIGISYDEYISFLRQFTEEAISYESGLRGNDFALFKDHISSIKDAAGLLNLSKIFENMRDIEGATSEEKGPLLDIFYEYISQIQHDLETDQINQTEEVHTEELVKEVIDQEEKQPETKISDISEIEQKESIKIDLADVSAIPFDFSAKTAANELGLPESLVNEFVADFVEQAKENLPIFEKAQQEGDLDTIQKTAHLLKGAASNLRIDPLADTLKDLQYNEDINNVTELVQKFLGQLKTLENFTGKSGI